MVGLVTGDNRPNNGGVGLVDADHLEDDRGYKKSVGLEHGSYRVSPLVSSTDLALETFCFGIIITQFPCLEIGIGFSINACISFGSF